MKKAISAAPALPPEAGGRPGALPAESPGLHPTGDAIPEALKPALPPGPRMETPSPEPQSQMHKSNCRHRTDVVDVERRVVTEKIRVVLIAPSLGQQEDRRQNQLLLRMDDQFRLPPIDQFPTEPVYETKSLQPFTKKQSAGVARQSLTS